MSAAPFVTVRQRQRRLDGERAGRGLGQAGLGGSGLGRSGLGRSGLGRSGGRESSMGGAVSGGAGVRKVPQGRSVRRGWDWGTVVAHVALFAVVWTGVYGFSMLLGYTKMEHARRETVRAEQRAKEARRDMVRLRERLDRLSQSDAVASWARSRGFVAPYGSAVEVVDGTL